VPLFGHYSTKLVHLLILIVEQAMWNSNQFLLNQATSKIPHCLLNAQHSKSIKWSGFNVTYIISDSEFFSWTKGVCISGLHLKL